MGRRLMFQAESCQKGMPLREFLRRQGITASLIRDVKYRGDGFWADGKPVFTDYLLQGGEKISLELPPEKDTGVLPQELPLHISYEDQEAAVLDKPAGMAVHPTLTIKEGTLANAWMGELRRRGETGIFRPLNRLDKNTSGLVLCARDAFAASRLPKTCQKKYLAIAWGEMPLGPGRIEAPIDRAEDSIIRRRVYEGGKPSLTEYRVLAAAGGYSLLEVEPKTGRTHQIRVHMAWVGHPLAGDDLYGEDKALSRHALHCGVLAFEGLTGPVEVRSPLPEDMRRLAQKAGLV